MKNMNNTIGMAITFAAFIFAGLVQGEGELIAYEGFEYATGQDLSDSTTGGIGWSTTAYGAYPVGYVRHWNVVPTDVAVSAGSLTGPSGFPASVGNSIKPGGGVATRQLPEGTGVDMAQDGAVVYFSYLWRGTGMAWAGDPNDYTGARITEGGYLYMSRTGSGTRLRAYAGAGGIAYDWSHSLDNDTTYLVAGKYWNDGGTIKMSGTFFDDGDSLAEPAPGAWMIAASATYTPQPAYRVKFEGGATDNGDIMDEFRMGTTFESVIPEPATFGLMGMGAVACIFIRNRFTI